MDAMQISRNLRQFNGSESFFRYHNLLITDGVLYLAQTAGCYWLVDLAWSYVMTMDWAGKEEFLTLKLRVRKKNHGGGWVVIDDGNGNILAKQFIPFTDFPLGRVTLWLCWNGDGYTVMLPSEY